jgi:hypothetical protein
MITTTTSTNRAGSTTEASIWQGGGASANIISSTINMRGIYSNNATTTNTSTTVNISTTKTNTATTSTSRLVYQTSNLASDASERDSMSIAAIVFYCSLAAPLPILAISAYFYKTKRRSVPYAGLAELPEDVDCESHSEKSCQSIRSFFAQSQEETRTPSKTSLVDTEIARSLPDTASSIPAWDPAWDSIPNENPASDVCIDVGGIDVDDYIDANLQRAFQQANRHVNGSGA